ncbi:MAG: histidine kinase [Acidimicrobiales bacterium]
MTAAPFGPVVSGVRWAAIALAALLAVGEGPNRVVLAMWVLALVACALWSSRANTPSVLPEAVVAVVAVGTTGAWESPFALCLVTPVIAFGFARGFAPAGRMAAAVTVAVSIPYALSGGLSHPRLRTGGQWVVELVLVAALAGYARRLFGEAEQRVSLSLDRVSQLSEANELLVSLHRVARSLPASLDLAEVTASTLTRLRTLVDCDVAVLLFRDDTTGRWSPAVVEGATVAASLDDAALPAPLRAATASSVASLIVSLGPGEGVGDAAVARSGLYAPLRARGALIGLMALEHHEPGHYGRRELALLDGFVEPAALAIDNARWFGRLRAMGADEERNRIARDMHDRVGQSLAYLSFKLERMASLAEEGPLRDELGGLRTEVRGVLGEVRETLSDLRADVSDTRGMVQTLQAFLDRVSARTDIEVSFSHSSTDRLPLLQERELWRIAQEAIVNVERHAKARHLRVRWDCDGVGATLAVADDGRGFSAGRGGRPDSYGIRGMTERADAIGARLNVESEPYVGTLVECRIGTVDR